MAPSDQGIVQLPAIRRRFAPAVALTLVASVAFTPIAVAEPTGPGSGQATPIAVEQDAGSVGTYVAEPAVIGSGADSKSIDRLYLAYFLRDADPAGRDFWTGRLGAGTSLSRISDQFSDSTEFRNRYGALSDGDFVTLVYRNVLGRSADPAGHASWTDALRRGASRGEVMLGFSDSQEFKTRSGLVGTGADSRSIERLYRAYFLRAADPAGLAFWTDQRGAGMPLSRISDEFARSDEFTNRYGALSDSDFVGLVYRNVLSRSADGDGFAHWTRLLGSGTSRGAVMLGFSDSEEFKKAAGAPAPKEPEQDPEPIPAPAPDDEPNKAESPAPIASQKPTAPAGTYAFMQEKEGVPVQWPACRAVKVVANFDGAPADAEAALRETLTALSTATRQDWVLEGTTTERAPDMDYSRSFRDPARYGDRYSPVLVSWGQSWPSETSAVGVGGFGSMTENGVSRIVTGLVTLDPNFRPNQVGMMNLLLHELGHVANLGHASANDQVMSASLRGYDTYQYGDQAGLARLGSWDSDCSTTSAYAMSAPSSATTGAYQVSNHHG